MLISRKVDIPTGGSPVQLVDADDFEGDFEVIVRSTFVYLGDSTVSDTTGFLWSGTDRELRLRLDGADSLYGVMGVSQSTTVHILAYSV